jgi:urease accessory protein
MQAISKKTTITVVGSLLALATGAAQAHTGHGASTFSEGLVHPFGLDHLLAMVAVGVWSVRVLPANTTWQGPATFLLALLLSAVVGASGVALPYLEHAIALSVVLFGAMLVCAKQRMPVALGLGLVALAAALHGLAHGAEMTTTGAIDAIGFSGYAAGFLLTTTLLQGGGVLVGLAIQRCMAPRAQAATAAAGLLFGGAGLYLLQQL